MLQKSNCIENVQYELAYFLIRVRKILYSQRWRKRGFTKIQAKVCGISNCEV